MVWVPARKGEGGNRKTPLEKICNDDDPNNSRRLLQCITLPLDCLCLSPRRPCCIQVAAFVKWVGVFCLLFGHCNGLFFCFSDSSLMDDVLFGARTRHVTV